MAGALTLACAFSPTPQRMGMLISVEWFDKIMDSKIIY
jgi:hypothetical protein